MTKFVLMPEEKGFFRGLGLHHAVVAAVMIASGHSLGFGGFMAVFAVGWYASREYGPGILPGVKFEVMDFVSPVLVSTGYLLW